MGHAQLEGKKQLEKSLQKAPLLCMVPVAVTCQLKAEEDNANWGGVGWGGGENEATRSEALHRVLSQLGRT